MDIRNKHFSGTTKLLAGQGVIEYALIIVFIAIVVLVVLQIFGPSLGGVFSQIDVRLSEL
jgi:pilus assembly protein Flp/PilA